MKIAFFCPYNFSRPGGVQNHIRSVAKSLSNQGHDVVVVIPRTSENMLNRFSHDDGLKTACFGASWKVTFNKTDMDMAYAAGSERREAKDWIRQEKFDVFHFHTPWASILSYQFLKWSEKSARIATFHDTPPDTLVGHFTRLMFTQLSKVFYRHLDRVLAVSESPASHLHKSATHPVFLVPPCVDLSGYLEQFRSRRNLEQGDVCRILFVGRLDERKGINVLLEAAALLKTEGVPFQLTIVGGGDALPALTQKAHQIDPAAIQMVGTVDNDEKYQLLDSHDIFCSPALYGESFGIVLIEAMASGMPVVGGDNSGYRTVVSNMRDNCLAVAGDAIDLAQKLERLIEDDDLRHSLGQWGHVEAQKYDVGAWIKQINEHYEAAIENKRRHT